MAFEIIRSSEWKIMLKDLGECIPQLKEKVLAEARDGCDPGYAIGYHDGFVHAIDLLIKYGKEE